MDTMTVSIIICTHNRCQSLAKTLDSVSGVAVPSGWDVELLLVDNASTDSTWDIISSYHHSDIIVRGLRFYEPGKAGALNHAIKNSDSDVLLFTDDDVLLPRNWIEGMCQPILRDAADAVAGGITLADSLRKSWITARHRAILASTETISESESDRLVGANMAISRSVFELIPGFDPELGPGRLGLAEDSLLSKQIQHAGLRLISAFDTVVVHTPDESRVTRDGFRTMAEKGGRSNAYIKYHWQHKSMPLWKLYTAWLYLHCQLLFIYKCANLFFTIAAGMSMEEFTLRQKLSSVRQYISQHGQPRRYSRYGLVKIDTSEAGTDKLFHSMRSRRAL